MIKHACCCMRDNSMHAFAALACSRCLHVFAAGACMCLHVAWCSCQVLGTPSKNFWEQNSKPKKFWISGFWPKPAAVRFLAQAKILCHLNAVSCSRLYFESLTFQTFSYSDVGRAVRVQYMREESSPQTSSFSCQRAGL